MHTTMAAHEAPNYPCFTFWVFLHILQTAEALVFKFCVPVDMSSINHRMTKPLNGHGHGDCTWSIFPARRYVSAVYPVARVRPSVSLSQVV